MSLLRQGMASSIVKKLITAITGLALVGFSITHLLGNLTLLSTTGEAFNAYTARLHSFGPLILVAEIGLLAFFLIHIVNGIRLKKNHWDARPARYQAALKSKKGPSKNDASSRNMALSGVFLMLFLVVHVIQFRFGPAEAEGYVTEVGGQQARDLHRLVVESFSNPWMVAFYVISMIFLGAHLKHGFWSALQSMGWLNRNTIPVAYAVSIVIALILGVGFLILPIWVYFAAGSY